MDKDILVGIINDDNIEAVNIEKNQPSSAIIASIPHGSSYITSEMRGNMRRNALLTNNDWFLNDLYSFLYKLNIAKISANYSRYIIDVNRNINRPNIKGDYTESLIYHKTTTNHKPTSKWTSEDKFHAVLETAPLTEAELAEYCRRKGIYADEVKL